MYCDLTKTSFESIYSEPDDILEFYYRILKHSRIYKRCSAYFNSSVFKWLKKGLPEFINNDGFMQLLLSTEVDAQIVKDINSAYAKKEQLKDIFFSKKEIIDQLKALSSDEDSSIFGYLIAVGKLDVKLAYKTSGIVHDKFGCVSDGVHNLVYLGSNNFTDKGMVSNSEAFQVTIDWDEPSKRELKTVRALNNEFDLLWTNQKKGVFTIDMPDPFIQEIISNINYEEIKKIKKNPNFIRLDINDNREVFLTSNINISNLLTVKNIGGYYSFLIIREKDYCFKGLERTNEIAKLKNIIQKISNNNNMSFYITKRASDFFNLHLRDYSKLVEIGNHIKDPSFLKTEEFEYYKEKINSILLRPLKDSQIVAATHIIQMEKSLNFSVPGSGKTATVLGAFEFLANTSPMIEKHVNKLIIVGPKNCAKSWKDEYFEVSRESRNHSPLCLINDDSSIQKIDVLLHDFPTSRVVILNYDLLTKIKNELLSLVNEKTMIVFDEIHRIKRTDSAKYEALLDIVFKCRFKVALTGTPLPNGYLDLRNMISLLHDDYVATFFGMYENELKHDDKVFRKTGVQNNELNQLLFPFYIRVNKKDLGVPVAEPDHIINVQTNSKERSLYLDIKSSASNEFETVTKMTEIGCVPFKCHQSLSLLEEMVGEVNISNVDDYLTSKLSKLIDVVTFNKRKCIIWCKFIDTINIVSLLFKKRGFKVGTIYGATSQEERDKIIDEFNYSNVIDILVTNPATLAESVSLHKSCHDAHYIELDYNLYQYLQSRDRIHRLGLKPNDKTNYYIYLNFYDDDMKISKDKHILEMLKKKEDLMQKSIDKGDFVFEIEDKLL